MQKHILPQIDFLMNSKMLREHYAITHTQTTTNKKIKMEQIGKARDANQDP